MSANVVSEKRKAAARKHADKTRTCVCGKVCRGNGGWSSHKRACLSYAQRETERDLTNAKGWA